MTNRAYLLDTSALLTLIEDEAGADRVEQILRTEPVIIPWMCVFEVPLICVNWLFSESRHLDLR